MLGRPYTEPAQAKTLLCSFPFYRLFLLHFGTTNNQNADNSLNSESSLDCRLDAPGIIKSNSSEIFKIWQKYLRNIIISVKNLTSAYQFNKHKIKSPETYLLSYFQTLWAKNI
jgi:hypothetical protein